MVSLHHYNTVTVKSLQAASARYGWSWSEKTQHKRKGNENVSGGNTANQQGRLSHAAVTHCDPHSTTLYLTLLHSAVDAHIGSGTDG